MMLAPKTRAAVDVAALRRDAGEAFDLDERRARVWPSYGLPAGACMPTTRPSRLSNDGAGRIRPPRALHLRTVRMPIHKDTPHRPTRYRKAASTGGLPR